MVNKVNKQNISNMSEKRKYVAPQLVVVKVRTEMGFQASAPLGNLLLWQLTESSNQVESYETHGLWNDEDDGFWL